MTPEDPNEEAQAVRCSCTKFLSYSYPKTARETLLDLADFAGPDVGPDKYGSGDLHDRLETRLTELLGVEAAVFMPSGKIAQLTALAIWCERRGNKRIGLHPRSHIEEEEGKAYSQVFDLQSVSLGHPNRRTELSDLEDLAEPLGAVAFELPLRPLGCLLPDWDELTAMSGWARETGTPFHADAARIWEVQPYYDRPLSEIAAQFDSLYVSFYKGLGGMAGAALCGPADLIAQAKVWQQRLGARLHAAFPMLLDALRGLDQQLPLMPAFHAHAKALARSLAALPGVRVTPDPPQANAMLVVLEGDENRLLEQAIGVSRDTGLWLFDWILPTAIQGLACFEITVRDASLDVSPEEAAKAIGMLAERLRHAPVAAVAE